MPHPDAPTPWDGVEIGLWLVVIVYIALLIFTGAANA